MANGAVCSFPGCGEQSVARRMCRRHYQQAWRADRIKTFAPKPPRPVAPTRCPADHKHAGSSVCYIRHQCRCDECCVASARRQAKRKKLQAYGRYDSGLVDAGPVREHVLMLSEFGIGYKRLAELAGIPKHVPRNLVQGRAGERGRAGELQKRMKRENAERILAVEACVENMAGRKPVPALGFRRRVQALVAVGWSFSRLEGPLGVGVGNLRRVLDNETVTADHYLAAVAVFDELWDATPPAGTRYEKQAASAAKSYARKRRWLPPLAWDDIDNDAEPPVPDVDEFVDEVAVESALAGERVRLSRAERREAVRRGYEMRWSDGLIGARIGVVSETVLRIRRELGLVARPQNELVDKDEVL